MTLEREACYRALAARDARFDGRFFVGVTSTGIYCRPICPAKLPKEERCTFHASAALAEAAGFRPCLRCRPEIAPGRPTSASVDALRWRAAAAVRRIEDGAMDEGSFGDLAGTLGVSERQLRRAVTERFGVSPVELAQTNRLLAAKRMLRDTDRPIGELALACGFGSLRRFNALFLARYGLSPSAMRRGSPRPDGAIVAELGYRPPLDFAALSAFLSARAIPGVERVEGGTYRRTVRIGECHGWLSVRAHPERSSLLVEVDAALAPILPRLLTRVRRLFDLDADPEIIADVLGPLAATDPGLRVPGAFDGFELGVRAILGQGVSVARASALTGAFAAAFGIPIEADLLFPTAEEIAALASEEIARIGIPETRAGAILALARSVAAREIVLTPGVDVEATKARLLALPGIGPWTAEYLSMRALAWPDAFPATDLVLARVLARFEPRAAESWRPWRSYAAMHLWNLE